MHLQVYILNICTCAVVYLLFSFLIINFSMLAHILINKLSKSINFNLKQNCFYHNDPRFPGRKV